MAARIQRQIAHLVISLLVAVISLPVVALAVPAPAVTNLASVAREVKSPVKIALAADGGFYVTDPRNGGVLGYDASGSLRQVIKTPGGAPQGVAVLTSGIYSGNLVVSQVSSAAIRDKVSGAIIKSLLPGPDASFNYADGVCVDDAGAIYLIDVRPYFGGYKSVVKKYDAVGNFVTAFGAGSLLLPAGISFDAAGSRIAVADAGAGNIKFFDKSGNPLAGQIGTTVGSGTLRFTAPQSIAFEYAAGGALNRLYVLDTFQSTIQVVDPVGPAFLSYIGSYGEGVGQLQVPTDVVFDGANKRLIVANGYGNIRMYGIDGGSTPAPGAGPGPVTLTLATPPSVVGTTSVALSGTVTAGASVSCTLRGIATPASVAGTSWSCTVAGLLAGNNDIAVAARNGVQTANALASVTYTAGGPVLTVNPVAAYGKVSPLLVSGTVSTGNVTVCNASDCATVTGPNWSRSVALIEGPNTITATAGSSVKTVNTVLDVTLPVVDVVSAVPAGAVVNGQVHNISGKVTDTNIKQVTVNGQVAQLQGGIFSLPVVGAASVTITATDQADNITTVGPRAINYDSSKVKVAVTSHADGAVVSGVSQTIAGTLSAAVASLTVNGAPVTPSGLAWSTNVTLVAGINTVSINADGASTKLTLFLDATNPAVSVSAPVADMATNKTGYTLTAQAELGVTLSSSVKGAAAVEQLSDVPFGVVIGQEGEGVYPVVVTAQDAIGNKSSVVRNLVYDVTPPTLAITPPAPSITTLAGTVELGATVVVTDVLPATPVTLSTPAVVNGAWSASLGAARSPFGLMVTATDAAGNTFSKSAVKPDGDFDANGVVDLNDVSVCMAIVVGTTPVTNLHLAHGDIGPLENGLWNPNGVIDIVDCNLTQRKAAGLPVNW